MPSPNSQARTGDQAAVIETIWTQIAQFLESRKHQIDEEIKHYPPPITACDRQFDYLLEQRRTVSLEIEQLQALRDDNPAQPEAGTIIDRFLDASMALDGDAKRRLRSELSERLINRTT